MPLPSLEPLFSAISFSSLGRLWRLKTIPCRRLEARIGGAVWKAGAWASGMGGLLRDSSVGLSTILEKLRGRGILSFHFGLLAGVVCSSRGLVGSTNRTRRSLRSRLNA